MGQFSHLPYRKAVGIMLLNAQGQVFIAKRIDTMFEAWQMPQGGIDEGEDATTAALRELTEETGIPAHAASIIAQAPHSLYYELPDALIPNVWGGQYQGQEQTWFLLRLNGDDSLINIATEHAEFSHWRWCDPQDVPNVIVPFKRKLYEDVLAAFSAHLS